MWFYGATVEGPGPEYASVENSVIKSASLGKSLGYAVSMNGWEECRNVTPTGADPDKVLLKEARVVDNEVWGKVKITKALKTDVHGNRYASPEGKKLQVSRLMD